jgi:hypothetical protein
MTFIEGLPHAAQGIVDEPGARAAINRQSLMAIEIARAGAAHDGLQHLAQGGGQILGVAGGGAASRGTDKRAITVVGIGGRAAGQHAIERIIGAGDRAITQQIPRVVVAPAINLVRGIIGAPTISAVD